MAVEFKDSPGQIAIEDEIFAQRRIEEGPLTPKEAIEAAKTLILDFKTRVLPLQDFREAVADLYPLFRPSGYFPSVPLQRDVLYHVYYLDSIEDHGVEEITLSVSAPDNTGFRAEVRRISGNEWGSVEFRDPSYHLSRHYPFGPKDTRVAVENSQNMLDKLAAPPSK